MRIGIDARFYSGEHAKGLGRYTEKLIEYCVAHDRKNQYVLFLPKDGIEAWRKRFGDLGLEEKGDWRLVEAPYRWYTWQEQVYMPRLIKKAEVDLMHFPHFNVPLLFRDPFVVTIHDLIVLKFPTVRASTLGPWLYKLKHLAGKLVMRHAAKSAKHVITVSEFSKQDICSYYNLPEEHVTVTYEAAHAYPSASTYSLEQEQKQLQEQFHVQPPYVLYVGNAYPHKNVEIFIDVAQQLKSRTAQQQQELPWKIVLVGKMDYFYERIRDEVQARGLDDVIQFAGFVTDEQLGMLYRSSTAYLFPSRYEGFGLPPLEAMQYGVPVISSSASCMPEILSDAALFVDPDDSSGILEAVERVLQDEDLRVELATKGKKRAAEFSWETMMQQTQAIYEQYG